MLCKNVKVYIKENDAYSIFKVIWHKIYGNIELLIVLIDN